MTVRVETWGSNEAFNHSLRLRQISASVVSTTDPLDDGSIAAQQPAPPAIAAPAPGSRALEAGYLDGGGIRTPALFVTGAQDDPAARSEEHTSELQSLMRNSYAVFCLKKKNKNNNTIHREIHQHEQNGL